MGAFTWTPMERHALSTYSPGSGLSRFFIGIVTTTPLDHPLVRDRHTGSARISIISVKTRSTIRQRP